MSHRHLRLASRLMSVALWVPCAALVHCIQLTDGSEGDGAPKTWGTAERIHEDDNVTAPDVAVDPAGNAVAVWSQLDGVWSSRFTPDDGWGIAAPIPDVQGLLLDLRPAKVAMDAEGKAIVVCPQSWAVGNIVSSHSNADGRWGPSHRIDDNSGDADAPLTPQISVSADGSAVAVWAQAQANETGSNIWSNHYEPDNGWSFARRIETNNAGDASEPQVAVDASGNAVAVWEQSDGTRSNIWSNGYALNGDWGTARLIETNNAGNASEPQVAVDPSGNAVVVWQQFDGTQYSVWFNRYTSAGWGVAERIESDVGTYEPEPQVAVDANGNAVAVWYQLGNTHHIWSKRYTPSGGWGTAESIDHSGTANAGGPRVAVDPGGHAVSVWRQTDTSGRSIWSNRYTPDAGWGVAQRIGPNEPGTRQDVRVAVDANGDATAIWSVTNTSAAGIWSNRLE